MTIVATPNGARNGLPDRKNYVYRGTGEDQMPGAAGKDDYVRDLVSRAKGSPAPEPEPEADYTARFATHLRARLRARGWDAKQLQERTGLSAHVVGRALNGNGADIAVADRIAREVGTLLPAMLGPYTCGTCDGTPPAGYRCLECDAEGDRL